MITDLITMIGNVGRSFFSVQHVVSGLAYVLGIFFIWKAIEKFKDASKKSSHDKLFTPTAYLLGGGALLYLPSISGVLANSVFGAGNILQYTNFNPYNIVSSMNFIIRTAGLIWFIRGCTLLVHASEPGVQHGPKGMTFLLAGIFAMNFDNSIYYLNWVMNQILSYTLTAPANSG